MKLITQTTLYYLAIAIVVFGVGGLIAYNLISQEISKETDYYLARSLEKIEPRLERFVERGWDIDRFNNSQMHIAEVGGKPAIDDIAFSDTLAMHPHLNQMETMRKLHVFKEIGGRTFEITMMDVIVEDSDIYESVVKIITRLFALLALALLAGSFFISRILLKPFNQTLSTIEDFKVQDPDPVKLPKTRTKEFSRLNQFISRMTGTAQKEYQALKKFSEDASHEIQTPLAIAKGKLDLLADSEGLTEEQFGLTSSAQTALSKLSQVSRSLSLLTKIGNQEFDEQEETDLTGMVNEAVNNFKELFEMQGLKVDARISPGVTVKLNNHLGTIMLNNLIHNAIKHNIPGGYVDIALDAKGLELRNSGLAPTTEPAKLFNRFEKSNTNGDSSGLGLSIVKEICDYHRMKIDYTYTGDHKISIAFAQAQEATPSEP